MRINIPLIFTRAVVLGVTACLLNSIIGCAHQQMPTPPPLSDEPIGVQIVRKEPSLKGMAFRVLLDFESSGDLAFIESGQSSTAATQPASPTEAIHASSLQSENRAAAAPFITRALAHTGSCSMALPAGESSFEVKLASLAGMSSFPDHWTLAGGYFCAKDPTPITVDYEADGHVLLSRTMSLPANQWTAVLLDVSPLADPNQTSPPVGVLKFHWPAASQPLWFDDLIVIDNKQQLSLADDPPPATLPSHLPASDSTTHRANSGQSPHPADALATDPHWAKLSARIDGFRLILRSPGVYQMELPAASEGNDGWCVEEACAERIELKRAQPAASPNAAAQSPQWWTLYADGRQFLDGRISCTAPISREMAEVYAEQHISPAEIVLSPEMGRLDRNTPGDDDNDGYNERTGAYQIIARGPGVQFTIIPHTRIVQGIMLEVAGLPSGKLIATMEGQLINQVMRLPNGHVLVEITPPIERQTTLELRVK